LLIWLFNLHTFFLIIKNFRVYIWAYIFNKYKTLPKLSNNNNNNSISLNPKFYYNYKKHQRLNYRLQRRFYADNSRMQYLLAATYYQLHIKQSKNNIFLTLLSSKGYVIKSISAGYLGFPGPKRPTTFAAQQVGEHFSRFFYARTLNAYYLVLHSPLNNNVRTAIFGLVAFLNDAILGILDLIPRMHNGIRKKKL